MKKIFVKVPARGMTIEVLLALWQEGKLYRMVETEEISEEEQLERCRHEALAYVSRIDDNSAAEWRGKIRLLWERIFNDEAFSECLVIQKGRNEGKLNRYIVTNIVFHLQALDVYLCDNLLELHKKLEGVGEKNSIYKGAGEYKLNSVQRQRLRELKENVAGQK